MHLSSHTSLIFAYRKGLHTDIFLKHGQDLSLKQVYPELQIVLKTFVQKGAALGFQSILQWQGFKGFGASLSKQVYRGFSQTAVRKKTERRRKRMKQMARESSLTAFSVLERETFGSYYEKESHTAGCTGYHYVSWSCWVSVYSNSNHWGIWVGGAVPSKCT